VIPVDAAESHQGMTGAIRAPGSNVLSLAPQDHNDFNSGSSLATAEITGVIALLRAKQSHLAATQAQVLQMTDPPAVPDACAALDMMLHHIQRCE
jgi:hypothetical protein